MKYLRVTMPDQTRWDVPAEVVAKHRAQHYADTDKETTFDKEFEFTMNDPCELRDWAENNMNWSDVKDAAKKAELIPMPQPDYQEGWVNGHKELLEY